MTKLTVVFQILQNRLKIEKKNGVGHKLFMDFKKVYDSVRKKVYNILTEVGIPLKLVKSTRCLNVIYLIVRVGKRLSDTFPTRIT